MMFFIQKNKKILLYFFILFSILSLIKNCIQALNWSADFQWFPSTLLLQGINHYQYFLDGGKPFLSQEGEYTHGLYVMLLPFASLDWELAKFFWMITNVVFVLAIPYMICKKFDLSKNLTIIIMCIFATCSPTRNVINYGQQSLLIMFFFILPFLYENKKSYLLSGISFFKYNVGFILPIYYLINKRFKYLFLSAIPSLVAWIIYFNMTNSEPITNLFEPLKLVFSKNYSWGGDVYSIAKSLEIFKQGFYFLNAKTFSSLGPLVISITICFFILIKISKINDKLLQLSLICLTTLVLAPHANYDYIFLLPLLIYSLKNFKNNKFNFYLIIFYFYLNKIFKHQLGFETGGINFYDTTLFILFFYCLIYNLFNYKHS